MSALYTSLQQSLRSVALIFFPATFITLIIWATSGSVNGNTADPLRAGIWLWLALHGVGFYLHLAGTAVATKFTYLPILGLVFPFFGMRSGYRRIALMGSANFLTHFYYCAWYLIITIIFALISGNHSLSPILWQVPVNTLTLLALAYLFRGGGTRNKVPVFRKRISLYLSYLYLLFGAGALLIGIDVALHLSTVENLSTVIAPGIVGSCCLLAIQILYLPNVVLNFFSYLLGFGFQLGANTLISPTHLKLPNLPAISIFGIIPTGKHPDLIYFSLIPVGLLFLIQLVKAKRTHSFLDNLAQSAFGIIFLALSVLLLSYLNRGEFLTPANNPYGTSWWKLSAALLVISIVTFLLSSALIALLRKLRHQSS